MNENEMIIKVGTIIRIIKEDAEYRVIYKENDYIVAILIEDRHKKIVINEFNEMAIRNGLIEKKCVLIETEYLQFDPEKLNDENRAIYLRNCEIVKEIQKVYGPCYFDLASKKSKPLVNKLASKYGLKPRAVIQIVKNYLQNGLDPYYLQSMRGIYTRGNRIYTNKAGRPNSLGNIGVSLDDSMREVFEFALKHYLSGRQTSYQNTYDWMCATYFTEVIQKDENNTIITTYQLLPLDKRPTLAQMRYYIQKNTTIKQREISRTSSREFRNNKRALTSDNLYNVQGPGDVVEIDEVEMDVTLVSELDHNQVIGRPIVHCIIDVYSRYILAVSVSFENNSVLGLTNCLINLAENKREFCKRFGIHLKDGIWDINIIPNRVRSDRGSEYRSKEAKRIFNELGLTLELEPPAMGSMKGQVEQLFHQFHSVQNELVENKGLITKRHDSNHNKKAILTINDIWMFVINQVLAHNMLTLKEYPMTKDMIKESIVPTPIEIWNYGCKKYGSPRPIVNPKQFEFIIRKKVKAKLSRKGLFWNGLYYTSNDPWLFEMMNSLGNKTKSIECRLDERNVGSLWFIKDDKIIETYLNKMRNGNDEYDGMTLRMYEEYKNKKQELISSNVQRDQEIRVARRISLEATIDNAQRLNENSNNEVSIKTTDIRKNRREESNGNLSSNTIQNRLIEQNSKPVIDDKEESVIISERHIEEIEESSFEDLLYSMID